MLGGAWEKLAAQFATLAGCAKSRIATSAASLAAFALSPFKPLQQFSKVVLTVRGRSIFRVLNAVAAGERDVKRAFTQIRKFIPCAR
jgi:hypothetical protein